MTPGELVEVRIVRGAKGWSVVAYRTNARSYVGATAERLGEPVATAWEAAQLAATLVG